MQLVSRAGIDPLAGGLGGMDRVGGTGSDSGLVGWCRFRPWGAVVVGEFRCFGPGGWARSAKVQAVNASVGELRRFGPGGWARSAKVQARTRGDDPISTGLETLTAHRTPPPSRQLDGTPTQPDARRVRSRRPHPHPHPSRHDPEPQHSPIATRSSVQCPTTEPGYKKAPQARGFSVRPRGLEPPRTN
jgi:hypothetical protein